jgi:hypothetical protein
MARPTPSRFANKSFSSGGEGPSSSAPEWAGRTKDFLAAAPEESPQASALKPDLSLDFRHSGWAADRKLVHETMLTLPGISARRLCAFSCCGANATVEIGYRSRPPGQDLAGATTAAIAAANPKYRIRSIKCHDRFCVPCSNERSQRVRHAILDYIHDLPDLSLITLTLAASDDPLSSILDRITKAFRALRQLPLWKKAVKGGVTIIETKIGAGSGKWHCHYHIVCQTSFMRQQDLSNAWFKVTGDSRIVDIRRVGARTGAVQYITKYITKAADRSILSSTKHLSEAITAFTGRRLVSTFGTFRGLQLMESVDEYAHDHEEEVRWEPIGSFDEIIRRAAAGEPDAVRILRAVSPRKFESSA